MLVSSSDSARRCNWGGTLSGSETTRARGGRETGIFPASMFLRGKTKHQIKSVICRLRMGCVKARCIIYTGRDYVHKFFTNERLTTSIESAENHTWNVCCVHASVLMFVWIRSIWDLFYRFERRHCFQNPNPRKGSKPRKWHRLMSDIVIVQASFARML